MHPFIINKIISKQKYYRSILPTSRPATQSTGSASFDPTSPGSVWGYWKADTGFTKDGSNYVSIWADQSGNNKNLSQATSANQPLYSSSQIGGYGSITFDGSTDYLSTGGYDATFIQPFSIIAIIKQITWTSNRQLLSGQGGSNISQYDTTPTIMEYSGGGLAVKVSPTLNNWIILTMVFNGTNSLIQVNDNASVGGATSSHTSSMEDLTIGSKYDGTSCSNVSYAELITYKKALNSTEISTLVTGYKTKFGI